jgi:hypothetical protein
MWKTIDEMKCVFSFFFRIFTVKIYFSLQWNIFSVFSTATHDIFIFILSMKINPIFIEKKLEYPLFILRKSKCIISIQLFSIWIIVLTAYDLRAQSWQKASYVTFISVPFNNDVTLRAVLIIKISKYTHKLKFIK